MHHRLLELGGVEFALPPADDAGDAGVGKVVADEGAGGDRDQDLDVENGVSASRLGHR